MPVRTAPFRTAGTRSGRFRFSVSQTSRKTIIDGKRGLAYRIFNTGPQEFQVDYGASEPATVRQRCSFDFTTPADSVTIGAAGSAEVKVEGIYELIRAGSPIRSGRFRFPKDAAQLTAEIIAAKEDRVYRIFNSGDHAFEVLRDSGAETLSSKESIDVSLHADALVTIRVASRPAQGIYELLDETSQLRDGRFKKAGATQTNTRQIISFSRRSNAEGFYRIFNGSETVAMGVFLKTGSAPPRKLFDVDAKASVDVYVTAGSAAGEKKSIHVGGVNDDAVDIEGSYAYLGSLDR